MGARWFTPLWEEQRGPQAGSLPKMTTCFSSLNGSCGAFVCVFGTGVENAEHDEPSRRALNFEWVHSEWTQRAVAVSGVGVLIPTQHAAVQRGGG